MFQPQKLVWCLPLELQGLIEMLAGWERKALVDYIRRLELLTGHVRIEVGESVVGLLMRIELYYTELRIHFSP